MDLYCRAGWPNRLMKNERDAIKRFFCDSNFSFKILVVVQLGSSTEAVANGKDMLLHES